MFSLCSIVDALDGLFGLSGFGPDPSFSRFLPLAYDSVGLDWKSRFQPDFVQRFNGLMLAGAPEVRRVFLAVFPSAEALRKILEIAQPGDLIFSHHPLDMRCGDPRGDWGCGFLPIAAGQLDALREGGLSYYSCHAPMDVHCSIGTKAALVQALGGRYVGGFMPFAGGFAGAVCDIEPKSTNELSRQLQDLLDVPYLHEEGPRRRRIERVAVVPGCGDVVSEMRCAADMGAQAYVTGEVFCHIDNDYGRARMVQMKQYIDETPMSLMGGSHAASEYLVLRTQMAPWFKKHGFEAVLVPEDKWWR